jgi:hypothetical protein
MRCQRGRCIRKGRRCRLKTTKRRFTQNAVARITHAGAPAISSGMAASCALPANTSTVISTDSSTLMPDFTIATPVIRPHAPMPGACGHMSRAPSRNAGCR